MSPFKPAGDEARWKVLYRLLTGTATGDVLTYTRIADELGLDPVRHRSAMSSAMQRASAEHLELDKRAVEVVRNEGYRVVTAQEHMRLAKLHNKRAGAQLDLAYSHVVNVDLASMDQEVRKGFEVMARGFLEQMEINRRLESKQRRTDAALAMVTQRSDQTEEEIAVLRDRLASLESRIAEA